MPFGAVTSQQAVKDAISEFKHLGRDEFLEKYHFGRALEWFVEVDGVHYDSKAIYGVAFGYETGQFLVPADFSGGESTVARGLRKLGFKIVKVDPNPAALKRNPTWIRDELILALDVYVQWQGNPPDKNSDVIQGLSQLLNHLNVELGTQWQSTLRNPNGVYMKLMNFRRFDPAFVDRGLSGLSRGGRLEEEVWKDFLGDAPKLQAVAKAIRDRLDITPTTTADPDPTIDLEGVVEAVEGRVLTVEHLRRERSAKLVKAKKDAALKAKGKLDCEACGFNFVDRYGDRGNGFIECHHIRPLATLPEGSKTLLKDLALICSNCHRMVHARRQWLSIDALKAVMKQIVANGTLG